MKLLRAQYEEYRARMQAVPSVDPMDPNFKKLGYVRYADDFLLGIIGSKEDARTLMQAVEAFLRERLRLEVSAEKSGIRHATEGVEFLGYDVWKRDGCRKVFRHYVDGHSGLQRDGSGTIKLSLPRAKVRAFAERHGFGRIDLRTSSHRNSLLRHDDTAITDRYNAELRGFANYYALAYDVKRKLPLLQLTWQASLFKTLAAKHRCSMSDIVHRCKVRPGLYVVRQQVGGKWKEVQVWTAKHLVLEPTKRWWIDSISFSTA